MLVAMVTYFDMYNNIHNLMGKGADWHMWPGLNITVGHQPFSEHAQ